MNELIRVHSESLNVRSEFHLVVRIAKSIYDHENSLLWGIMRRKKEHKLMLEETNKISTWKFSESSKAGVTERGKSRTTTRLIPFLLPLKAALRDRSQ